MTNDEAREIFIGKCRLLGVDINSSHHGESYWLAHAPAGMAFVYDGTKTIFFTEGSTGPKDDNDVNYLALLRNRDQGFRRRW